MKIRPKSLPADLSRVFGYLVLGLILFVLLQTGRFSGQQAIAQGDCDAFISFEQTISGTISSNGQQLTYCFTGTDGQWVSIRMMGEGEESNLDAYLELYDPHNNRIAYDDDFWLNNPFILAMLPSSGSYKLVASGFGSSTGAFRLRLASGQKAGVLDLNRDCLVDDTDYQVLDDNYRRSHPDADIDMNGLVTIRDYLIFTSLYSEQAGLTCSTITPPDSSCSANVPLLKQTDERWATFPPYEYDHGGGDIGTWGCALTSYAMLINFHGQGIGFKTDPESLNEWLKDNKGYYTGKGCEFGCVIPKQIAKYAREHGVSLFYEGKKPTNDELLGQYLCDNNPVVLGVYRNGKADGHFVVAKGTTTIDGGETWLINDPAWNYYTTLDGGRDNVYTSMRLFSSGPFRATALMAYVSNNVSLMVTDPLGRRTGYDPDTDRLVNEIPHSAYYTEGIVSPSGEAMSGTRIIEILGSFSGIYQYEVVGESSGTYELGIIAYDSAEAQTRASVSGQIAPGETVEYPVDYSTEPDMPVRIDKGYRIQLPLIARNHYADVQPTPTPSPTDTPPSDDEAPIVNWIAPVGNDQVYHVSGEVVQLEVSAMDNVAVQYVWFSRWDAANEEWVWIGTDWASPYQANLDSGTLNYEWNQVFAEAYDTAGNRSERRSIWLYRDELPSTATPTPTVRPGTGLVGQLEMSVDDIHVVGGYAYIANGNLSVVDVSDPTAPREVAVYDTRGDTFSVFADASYAYMTSRSLHNWDSGLTIIDVSNPLEPREVGFLAISSGYPEDIYVAEDYAYIANSYGGMVVIDVSNPVAPRAKGRYYPPIDPGGIGSAHVQDVFVKGDYAYIGADGLRVVDVSAPPSLPEIGAYELEGWAGGIHVLGSYVYLISFGLQVLDVSNPTIPVLIGSYRARNYDIPEDVFVDGGYAYLVTEGELENGQWVGGNLSVFDISDPTALVEDGYYDTPRPQAVYVARGYAYVADQDEGLLIYRVR